jgi:heme/copper-type cytochrome/quinol oxidase subunit 1
MVRSRSVWLPLAWLIASCAIAGSDMLSQTSPVTPRIYVPTYFVVAHPGMAWAPPAWFALFAVIYAGLSFVPAIRIRGGLAWTHLLISFLGACLIKGPAIALQAAGTAASYQRLLETFVFWNRVIGLGYGLLLAGLVLFVLMLIDGLRPSRMRKQA